MILVWRRRFYHTARKNAIRIFHNIPKHGICYNKHMRNFTASQVLTLYRRIYAAAFTHVVKPRFKIHCGLSGEVEICGLYDPNINRIEIWLDEHENLFEIADTLVHELCHAEQEKRLQPLLHGARFSRRIRNRKRAIKRNVKC